MKVTLAYAERQLRHWTRKVAELRLTSNASNEKEGEKGKEILPPTPLNREKGKAEENIITRARTCKAFVPPTLEEVTAYCRERHNSVDPICWWNFYASKGWQIGRNKMVDWKRCVITWERTQRDDTKRAGRPTVYVDPKVAAFERQREENERRQREFGELAKRLTDEMLAVQNGGVK